MSIIQSQPNKKRTVTDEKSPLKRWWSFLLPLSLVFFLFSGILTFLAMKASTAKNKQPPPKVQVVPKPTKLENTAILLMGYGGGNHDGGKLTDTMIEAYIQPEKRLVSLISIPRDLWISLPVKDIYHRPIEQKINFAYALGADDRHFSNKPAKYSGTHGGLNLAKDVVGQITGIQPKFALAVDFHGFLQLLKSIGPIKVNVPYSFSDNFYPIEGKEKETCDKSAATIKKLTQQYHGFALEKQFPCRYEKIQFKKGVTLMDANTALKFVRSRHGDGAKGDFGRSQRQEALLLALKNKLLQPQMILRLPQLVSQTFKLVDTDITTKNIFTYIRLLTNQEATNGLDHWRFRTIVLDNTNVFKDARSINGAYILQPRASINFSSRQEKYQATASTTIIVKKQNPSHDPWLPVKQFIQTELNQSLQATVSATQIKQPSMTPNVTQSMK